MSVVTNCILTFGLGEDEVQRLDEVDRFFTRESTDGHTRTRGFGCVVPNENVGGTKNLETNVAVGAFNYLGLRELCCWIASGVQWEDPTNVQLFVNEQGDDVFRLLSWADLVLMREIHKYGGE